MRLIVSLWDNGTKLCQNVPEYSPTFAKIVSMQREDTFTIPANEPDKFLPSVSIDCVIFGFHDGQIKVLLINFKSTHIWALPGGYIRIEEDMDEAASRILWERTAVQNIFLEQFHAFGHRERVCRDLQQTIFDALSIPLAPNAWISQRFVSVGYYALVDFSKVLPNPDEHLEVCTWIGFDELPPLAFDHSAIVQKALTTLQSRLDHNIVGFNLLPDTFTMAELQSLYETILGKKLLRANFQRKMLGLEILKRVEKRFSGRAHKAPYLYRFDSLKSSF